MNINFLPNITLPKNLSFKAQKAQTDPFYRNKPDDDKARAALPGPECNPVLSLNIERRDKTRQTIKEIQSVLDKCQYGKSHMLDNIDDLSVVKKDGKYYLNGFYNNYDKDDEFTGLCEELICKAGRILEDKFGDKYNVIVLFAECMELGFKDHSCLALVKRNPQSDKIIALRNEIVDIHKKMQLLETQKDTNFNRDYKELQIAEDKTAAELREAMGQLNFLDDAIFVDPSTKCACKINDAPLSYEFTGFSTLQGANTIYDSLGHIIEFGATTQLGATADIFPELEKLYPNSTLCFSALENQPYAVFVNKNELKGVPLDALKEYFPNNKVVRFLDKLNNEMNRAKNQ